MCPECLISLNILIICSHFLFCHYWNNLPALSLTNWLSNTNIYCHPSHMETINCTCWSRKHFLRWSSPDVWTSFSVQCPWSENWHQTHCVFSAIDKRWMFKFCIYFHFSSVDNLLRKSNWNSLKIANAFLSRVISAKFSKQLIIFWTVAGGLPTLNSISVCDWYNKQ